MNIDSELAGWHDAGEQVAVATVVAVHGSVPRSLGARFALSSSGRMAGSVSGGCVEGDVCRRAQEVITNGRAVTASFAVGETGEAGVALSCGGGIEVPIERFADDAVWRASRSAAVDGRAVVRVASVAPISFLGRRMTVSSVDVVGSIASDVDAAIIEAARSLLQSGGDAGVQTVGSGSRALSVFLEPVHAAARVFIVGGTDTASALARIAKVLGFRVVLLDAREAYLSARRFPDADEIRCAWPADVLADARLDERSHVVTLTHDAKIDVPALAAALRSPACYIGALGSRRTHALRRERLADLGFRDSDLARIHAPIGLDLGGRAPEEIALSIASEIVANRYGRESRSLVTEGLGRRAG